MSAKETRLGIAVLCGRLRKDATMSRGFDGKGNTVPFRPTQFVICHCGTACRIFGSVSSIISWCRQVLQGHLPPGWLSVCWGPLAGAQLSSSSNPSPLSLTLLFFCHQPPPRRVGRNGTVYLSTVHPHALRIPLCLDLVTTCLHFSRRPPTDVLLARENQRCSPVDTTQHIRRNQQS